MSICWHCRLNFKNLLQSDQFGNITFSLTKMGNHFRLMNKAKDPKRTSKWEKIYCMYIVLCKKKPVLKCVFHCSHRMRFQKKTGTESIELVWRAGHWRMLAGNLNTSDPVLRSSGGRHEDTWQDWSPSWAPHPHEGFNVLSKANVQFQGEFRKLSPCQHATPEEYWPVLGLGVPQNHQGVVVVSCDSKWLLDVVVVDLLTVVVLTAKKMTQYLYQLMPVSSCATKASQLAQNNFQSALLGVRGCA